jgi:hypothetical protein
MKVVTQFLSIVLFISCFSAAFGQDLPEGKEAPKLKTFIPNFTNQKFDVSNPKRLHTKIGSPNNTQGNHIVLPANGGTSGNSRAPQGYYRYERTCYLITPSEMASAGVLSGVNFTTLGWSYSTAQNVATTGAFKVYFMNTSDAANNLSTTWATAIAGMTMVDSSTDNIPASASFIHTLSNPTAFTYTGGGLYIAWEYSNPSGTAATTANVASCNVALTNGLKGAQSNTGLPTTIAASAYRPETLLGYYIGSDAQVAGVYSLGILPLGIGVPNYVQATIFNSGDVDFTSLPCTLKVTGSNAFSNIQTIPSLPVGYYTQLSFAAFSPTVVGSDVLTVTLPTDAVTANNTLTGYQSVNNNNTMAYSDGTTTFYSALGFNTGTVGSFLSKFYVNGNVTLKSTKIFIYDGPGKTVRGIAYDRFGNVIAQTADYVVLASDTSNYVTFTFPTPATINNDSIYVGLLSTGAASYWPVGLQSENWTREGAFFTYTSSGGFQDDASQDYGIFMIEANFTPILPVELTSFTSNVFNGKVNLSWITATELNNNGFQIERTLASEVSWSSVGFVKGAGNSSNTIHYSFTDNSVNSGKYNYRLKQIDYDGKYKYSDLVNADVNVPGTFSLSQNYPNPFNPSTKIDYTLPVDSRVKVEIYNIAGQKIADVVNNEQSAGFYSLNVSANSFKNISSGVYIYKMTAIEKATGKNFVSSKKLMLMK